MAVGSLVHHGQSNMGIPSISWGKHWAWWSYIINLKILSINDPPCLRNAFNEKLVLISTQQQHSHALLLTQRHGAEQDSKRKTLPKPTEHYAIAKGETKRAQAMLLCKNWTIIPPWVQHVQYLIRRVGRSYASLIGTTKRSRTGAHFVLDLGMLRWSHLVFSWKGLSPNGWNEET